MTTPRGGSPAPSRARSRGVVLPPINGVPPCLAIRAAVFDRYSLSHAVSRGADRRRPMMLAAMSLASYCTRACLCSSRREHLTSAINRHGVWLTRPNQEVSDRHRVKVEHLSAGQFSIAHLIESEDRCVQAFPIGASTALSPEHDDLSVGG